MYPMDDAAVEAFVAGQRHGYLIATPPDGFPQVSILPFVKDGDTIELHAVQEDPTFRALEANPRATFFVGDFLAFSPHYWVDPENAARGTLHFRAVQYACEATISTSPDAVAAALRRMLDRYEPGASYRPVRNDGFYGPRLERLGTARLRIVEVFAKFKVGPAGPNGVKLTVARHLRERAEPGDVRAAEVIEAAVQRG
jgi:transcriptional regulator